jgi:hypothetical protein
LYDFLSKGSEDILSGGSSSKMTLYHMELYRDKEHTEALDFSSPDPSVREAEFDETLYVRAWIDGGKFCNCKYKVECSVTPVI